MTKAAVILSGCGFKDGAEIREAVLTLLYLDAGGAEVEIFAPDIEQKRTVNHLTGQETAERRSVLVEAARIARGAIRPLSALKAEAFDALLIPGGFGVALNLSDLAEQGAEATVREECAAVLRAFFSAGKPIGAICIAPAMLAAALPGSGARLTIGEDAGTAGVIESFGGTHVPCVTAAAVVDEAHRVVSCPAYMRADARISEVAEGIRQVVKTVLEWAEKKRKAA
jgi:enhancing lycopene biosynthesis protein 2